MAQRRKILVVDDEEKLSRFVRICLEREGFEVTTAKMVAKALPLLESGEWDLVITDLIMPMDSGFTLVQWLKIKYPNLPVIMMTAHSPDLVSHQATQLGAADVLFKPFALEQLRQAVRKALGL